MSSTFNPPIEDDVPPVLPQTGGIVRMLLGRYKNRARGQTVLKIDGVYATYKSPTQDEVDSATEVYLGGHTYEVDDDIATALTAAGYGDNIT